MNKERLEEAKAWRSDLLLTLVTGDLSEKLQNHTRKYKNILNYLIEQAERVQELERRNRTLSDNHFQQLEQYRELAKQNKRYREYLRRLQRATTRYPAEDMAYVVNKITDEALEETK